jgi:hypothetical protein
MLLCRLLSVVAVVCATPSLVGRGPNMTQAQLTGYLSRALTMSGWLSPTVGSDPRTSKNVSDSIRVLTNTGAKYAGRSVFLWGQEQKLPAMVAAAMPNAKAAHAADPDLVLEAAIFEIVTKTGVEQLEIPSFVFDAFGLPPQRRNFSYAAMLFPDGTFVNKWGEGQSVPDLTQQEARMWFFFAASQYIQNAEVEALHLGQIMLMSRSDKGMLHTAALLKAIRGFAAQHGRRQFVLCNAHIFEDPWVHVNFTQQLLMDFHAFPSVPNPQEPYSSVPQKCALQAGFLTAMYGKSAGGVSVDGWRTAHLPYLVELDNYDCTRHPGVQDPTDLYHPFGWDEISWFAHQPAAYRGEWLTQAAAAVRMLDPAGHFQMPGLRCLCDPAFSGRPDTGYYSATSQDPKGFGQEEAIKAIFARASPGASALALVPA